jgi:hypothetical protein
VYFYIGLVSCGWSCCISIVESPIPHRDEHVKRTCQELYYDPDHLKNGQQLKMLRGLDREKLLKARISVDANDVIDNSFKKKHMTDEELAMQKYQLLEET